MSDYITREQAMSNIKAVIGEMHMIYYDKDHINDRIRKDYKVLFEPAKKSIKEKMWNIIEVYKDAAYREEVKSLEPKQFVEYYGKICELARALELDIFLGIKNKTLIVEGRGKKSGLYFYFYHYYVGDNSKHEKKLTKSSYQMVDLFTQYRSVYNASNVRKGAMAKKLRGEIRNMDIDGLFEIDEDFMNIYLRDFLNLNDDGTMNYILTELIKANGWTEMPSFGSMYHQDNTNDEMYFPKKTVIHKGVPIDMPLERLLNAKFTNDDGREVVMNPKGIIVTNDVDKGTYNYANAQVRNLLGLGEHKRWDMDEYIKSMEEDGIDFELKLNMLDLSSGNTKNWPEEKNEE